MADKLKDDQKVKVTDSLVIKTSDGKVLLDIQGEREKFDLFQLRNKGRKR